MPDLPSILDAFICVPDCPTCKGTGTVCEDHQHLPWGEFHEDGCHCGAAGAPCPERRTKQRPSVPHYLTESYSYMDGAA